MTERQKRFVDEYIKTGNASESARRAGYSAKTAYSIGEENLRKPEIRAAIDERLEAIHSDGICQAEENMRYLSKVVRGQYKEEVVTQSGKTVRIQIPTEKRIRAAELLLKIQGKFKEATQTSVTSAYLQALREWDELENEDKAVTG